VVLYFSAPEAKACACCTDPGEYRLSVDEPISDDQRAQLGGLMFASAARLFLTDAGEDAVKRLASISPENIVTVALAPRSWRFTFKAEDGQTGVLVTRRQ
jgi:hypothetical protein